MTKQLEDTAPEPQWFTPEPDDMPAVHSALQEIESMLPLYAEGTQPLVENDALDYCSDFAGYAFRILLHDYPGIVPDEVDDELMNSIYEKYRSMDG